MPENDELNLKIQFDLAQREVTQAQRGIKQVTTSVVDFQKQQTKLAAGMQTVRQEATRQVRPIDQLAKATVRTAKGQRQLADDSKKATNALKEQQKAAANLDARLERLDEDFSQISRQVGQAGDIESNIRAISGAAATIPGLQGVGVAGGAGAELFATIEAVPRLKVAFQGLPAIVEKAGQSLGTSGAGFVGVLGSLGVAAIGVSIAVKAVTARLEEAAEAARKEAEARQVQRDVTRDINELIASGDIETALQERERLFQDAADAARDQIAEEEVLRRQRLEQKGGLFDINPIVGGIQTLNPVVEAQAQVVSDLTDKSINAQAALTAADAALSRVSDAEIQAAQERIAAKEAAEAAAEAERALAEQRQEAVARINADVQLQHRLASAEDQTSGQIEKRIEAITREDGILADQIVQLDAVGAETDDLRLKLRNLALESIALRDDILPLVEAREAEQAVIERQTEARKKAREQAVVELRDARARVDKLEAINESIEKAESDHVSKLADISDNLSRAIDEAALQRAEKIADAERDARKARAEAVLKAQADIEKLETQHRKRLKDIVRRSNATIANAIGERDALALLLAQQNKKEQLKNETDAFQESRRTTIDQLRQTNRAIAQRLDEQRRTAIRSYNDTVRKAQDAARRQATIENQKYRELIRTQQAAANRIVAESLNKERLIAEISRRGAAQAIGIHSAFWQRAVQQAQASLNALQAAQNRAFTQTSTAPAEVNQQALAGTGNALSSNLTFQHGGTVPRTGLIFAHAGERILTRSQQSDLRSRGGGSGLSVGSININGLGMNRRQIVDMFDFELNKRLDEAGID